MKKISANQGKQVQIELSKELLSRLGEETERLSPVLQRGKRSKPMARELLKAGEDDLVASQLLYEQRLYSLSAYHLQQSAEKLTKCLCKFYGIKFHHHRTPRGFLKLLKEYKELLKLGFKVLGNMVFDIFDSDVGMDVDGTLAKADEALAKLENSRGQKEVARMDYEKICSFLSIVEQIKVKVKEQRVEDTIGLILDQLKKQSSVASPQVKGSLEGFDYKANLDLSINACALYVIDILTFPHEACRYPDSKVLKPSEYDPQLGIVRASSQIQSYLEDVIESLKAGLHW